MFNIFRKSKPKLSEIIPNGFIDIHSHVLPGVDDGPKNIADSIDLIDSIVEIGFEKIITTPHTYPGLYDNTNYTLKNSYDKLIKEKKNGIKIDYASEYMIDQSLKYKAEERSLLTIKDSYVLIEMNFIAPPPMLYDVIFNLIVNNYIPILAHPERYRFLHNDFDQYKKLKDHGCKFQLNLLSTVGFYGKDITLITDKLLKNNLIDYVGSDIHSINHVKSLKNTVRIKQLKELQISIQANSFFLD